MRRIWRVSSQPSLLIALGDPAADGAAAEQSERRKGRQLGQSDVDEPWCAGESQMQRHGGRIRTTHEQSEGEEYVPESFHQRGIRVTA